MSAIVVDKLRKLAVIYAARARGELKTECPRTDVVGYNEDLDVTLRHAAELIERAMQA